METRSTNTAPTATAAAHPVSPFYSTAAEELAHSKACANYRDFKGKSEGVVLFRDLLDSYNGIELEPKNELHLVIIKLLDTNVLQRLKYVKQASFGEWVFKDLTQCRFVHSFGSAVLTAEVLDGMKSRVPDDVRKQIDFWGPVCVAFAMVHDLGHIAPRSHVAQRVWFPRQDDAHEQVSLRIIREHEGLRVTLSKIFPDRPDFPDLLERVMSEDASVPRWTWQLITGGGWNTDRGDWVRRDGKMCGSACGEYDFPLIKKNLSISDSGELVIKERGLGALEDFFHARATMYEDVYSHPVACIAEEMAVMIGERVRELYGEGQLDWHDEILRDVISAHTVDDLSLQTLLDMTDDWWDYGVKQLSRSNDPVLRELCSKQLLRRPFKHFDDTPEMENILTQLCRDAGRDPRYWVRRLPSIDVHFDRDLSSALKVENRDGSLSSLVEKSGKMRKFAELQKVTIEGRLIAPLDIWRDQATN